MPAAADAVARRGCARLGSISKCWRAPRRSSRSLRAAGSRYRHGRDRRHRGSAADARRGAGRQEAAARQQGSAGHGRPGAHAGGARPAARRCCRSTASTTRFSRRCRAISTASLDACGRAAHPAHRLRRTVPRHAGDELATVHAGRRPARIRTGCMGRKISVDSATMMNKGLEVIEARWLFDARPDADRGGDPSRKASCIRWSNTSTARCIAQLGNPDMRTPIAHALGLSGAHRRRRAISSTSRASARLHFERARPRRAFRACASPTRRSRPAAARPRCSTPRTKSRWRASSPAASAFTDIAELIEAVLARVTRRSASTLSRTCWQPIAPHAPAPSCLATHARQRGAPSLTP